MSHSEPNADFLAGMRFAADWIRSGAEHFAKEARLAKARAVSGFGEPSYEHWRAIRAEDRELAKRETADTLLAYANLIEKEPQYLDASLKSLRIDPFNNPLRKQHEPQRTDQD